MMKLLLLFVLINYFMLQPVSGFEVSPERHELEYLNRKYLSYLSVSFRKRARNGPYYINLALETHTACGNNVKLKMALYEFLSGRYILTPVQVAYKLCDFLYKEPFFGQMYAKQLPGNWSCPFPPGKYNFTNLVMHLENFPHYLPFTYNSLIVRTCVDVQAVIAATDEEMFRFKTYVKVTQAMESKSKPKSHQNLKKNKTITSKSVR